MQEAEAALQKYVPLVKELTGKDTVLDRIWPLMERAGNPQDNLKIIHIAGTSGKTSTAYFMAALLQASGKKVGLTVSPHVDSITERIQINGQPLDDARFCSELSIFLEIVDQVEQKPSYFELLYAFALWVCEREKVDYAIVETGMGGLHDATNVARKQDKVCIITDIGYDHTHILGTTLPAIAGQKIGIVHPGNVVFTYKQSPEIMHVFQEWTTRQQAALHVCKPLIVSGPHALPAYQYRNWSLAYQAYEYLAERDSLPTLSDKQRADTQAVQVPGRMDVQQLNGKTVIMDGAHNEQKIAAFVHSFVQLYPDVVPTLLVGFKEGKDYEAAIPLLASISSTVIVTAFKTSQDLPVVAASVSQVAKYFQSAGLNSVTVLENPKEAYDMLLGTDGDVKLVVGSFYLISQIRRNS